MGQPRYMQLDPLRDHETIIKWMVVDTWRFDLIRSTEIALLKTFAIPEISKILMESKEFKGPSVHQNIGLLISIFIENGYSSPVGMKAIQSLKRLYPVHLITNQQMLYIVSNFVIEPIQWIESFGWRPLMNVETQALFHFGIEVAHRLGIKDLPSCLKDLVAYQESYEKARMAYSENNISLYRGMTLQIGKTLPFPLGQITPWILPGLMSPGLCEAFAVKPKPQIWCSVLQNILKIRGYSSQLLPSRPHFRSRVGRSAYANSSQINQVSDELELQKLRSKA